jgi:transposase
MKASTTKNYTREFRENAVRLAGLPGKTISNVAIELGVPHWKLRTWIKESKDKLERSSEIDELIALQKRVRELEEENLILKKAAAYFAKNLV